MTNDFEYDKIAKKVLTQYDQSTGFAQRFRTFCQNAMEGKAEETDLARLIENVELNEEEQVDES